MLPLMQNLIGATGKPRNPSEGLFSRSSSASSLWALTRFGRLGLPVPRFPIRRWSADTHSRVSLSDRAGSRRSRWPARHRHRVTELSDGFATAIECDLSGGNIEAAGGAHRGNTVALDSYDGVAVDLNGIADRDRPARPRECDASVRDFDRVLAIAARPMPESRRRLVDNPEPRVPAAKTFPASDTAAATATVSSTNFPLTFMVSLPGLWSCDSTEGRLCRPQGAISSRSGSARRSVKDARAPLETSDR